MTGVLVLWVRWDPRGPNNGCQRRHLIFRPVINLPLYFCIWTSDRDPICTDDEFRNLRWRWGWSVGGSLENTLSDMPSSTPFLPSSNTIVVVVISYSGLKYSSNGWVSWQPDHWTDGCASESCKFRKERLEAPGSWHPCKPSIWDTRYCTPVPTKGVQVTKWRWIRRDLGSKASYNFKALTHPTPAARKAHQFKWNWWINMIWLLTDYKNFHEPLIAYGESCRF